MTRTFNDMRARDARARSDFYSGKTDRHPQGEAAKRFLLPRELTSNTRDTAPGRESSSEWGQQCGWDDDPWVSRKASRIARTKTRLSIVVDGLEALRDRIKRERAE